MFGFVSDVRAAAGGQTCDLSVFGLSCDQKAGTAFAFEYYRASFHTRADNSATGDAAKTNLSLLNAHF